LIVKLQHATVRIVKGHQVNTVPLSAFTARDWLLQGPGT